MDDKSKKPSRREVGVYLSVKKQWIYQSAACADFLYATTTTTSTCVVPSTPHMCCLAETFGAE